MKRKIMTIVRTILLVLALLNQILGTLGAIDFGDKTANTIYKIISMLATVGAAAWAWWKNNSVTENAQIADEYLDALNAADNCGTEGEDDDEE